MPEIKPDSVVARAQHSRSGTFFRKDATEILEPDDLSEGAGDLTTLDKEGNPLSVDGIPYFRVESVENSDAWAPYIGTASQGVNGPTKQVASPLPIARNSFMANQPPLQGDLSPGLLAAAKIPRPLAPLLVAEPAGVEGYAAGPETAPYFVAFTWVRGGRHSLLSPFTLVPAVEFGQSIRAILASEIPEGVDGIGIWLTEPGTSTPTLPGPAKLQRVVDISRYNPGTYDLTGPYRHEKGAPTRNETLLPSPTTAPTLLFRSAARASKPGTYFSVSVWTDANGESLASTTSRGVTITASSRYTNDSDPPEPIAGAGYLTVTRGANPPPGATGWRPLVYHEGNWHAVYDSYQGLGNEKPYPLNVTTIQFTGWGSATDSEWSANERVFLVQRDLPTENTTGIEAPTDALEQPVVFGVVRYPAGTYYAGITEFVRGIETVLSPTASITINSNQVLRVIRQDRVQAIPNADNLEIGADGLPLDQTTIITGGSAVVEASDPELVLRTSAATTGTTPSNTTRTISVKRNTKWRVRIKMSARNPQVGTFQGSGEAVLEEINSSGAVTQTVLGTISAPGDLYIDRVVHAANDTATLKWQTDTQQARILIRYSGTTKNLEIRIRTRRLYPNHHASRLKRRRHKDTYFFDVPDSTSSGGGGPGDGDGGGPGDGDGDGSDPPIDPPGSTVGIVLPPDIPPTYEPIPGPTPALVEWAAPDRPSSSGVLLEAKHDFETAIPARWKQHTNGASVTLTRYATSPLAGTYSLRSYKAS